MYFQNAFKLIQKHLYEQKYISFNIKLNVFTYLELTFYSGNNDKIQIPLAFLNIRHVFTSKCQAIIIKSSLYGL